MKKLITLLAVFLIGTASVFAQWDCDVTWSYLPNADCCPEELPSQNYGIRIELDIYDLANTEQITNPNPTNYEDLDDFSTYFNETQCQVKDYCEKDHDDTPSFTVTATVTFYNLTTQEDYCYAIGQVTGKTCTQFYNSNVVVPVVFN